MLYDSYTHNCLINIIQFELIQALSRAAFLTSHDSDFASNTLQFLSKKGIFQFVFPADYPIFLIPALFSEMRLKTQAETLQYPAGSRVLRIADRIDAMKPQGFEAAVNQRFAGF